MPKRLCAVASTYTSSSTMFQQSPAPGRVFICNLLLEARMVQYVHNMKHWPVRKLVKLRNSKPAFSQFCLDSRRGASKGQELVGHDRSLPVETLGSSGLS